MWYLHAPDRATPYEDTLREVNNLYQKGFFRRFGISNYAAWEVAQISENMLPRELLSPLWNGPGNKTSVSFRIPLSRFWAFSARGSG